jgi:hypothetical protein
MTPDQVGLAIADRFVNGAYTGRDNLAMHISSAINQAMADERERCARVADKYASECEPTERQRYAAEEIAAAIRKGG